MQRQEKIGVLLVQDIQSKKINYKKYNLKDAFLIKNDKILCELIFF